MRYPYLEMLRGGRVRTLPVVPVRLFGARKSVELSALVDSGAEHGVFPLHLIEHLELATAQAVVVTIVGVGGKSSRGLLLESRLQLARFRWKAPVAFSAALDSLAILGQYGFFAYFSVTFRFRQRYLEIRRDRT